MVPVEPTAAPAEADFERYRDRIYRHVRRMVRSRADAEDLTQETFLRAHRQLAELRDPASMAPWLYRIATNACCEFLRPSLERRAHHPGPDGDGPERAEELELAAEGPGLDHLLDQAAMSACGAELLERLPPSYRTVLLLHDLQGLTSIEVARLLRCTPGAVKIRLHRARREFRVLLEAGCELYRDERGVLLGARKLPRREPTTSDHLGQSQPKTPPITRP